MDGQNRNICKFVTERNPETLVTANFILESEAPLNESPLKSQQHIMHLVTEGSGILHIADRDIPVLRGALFFTMANMAFRIEKKPSIEYMYISFSGTRSEELFRRFGISESSLVFEGCEGLIPTWRESLSRANGENIDLLSESILLYSFSKLRDISHSDPMTEKAMNFIDENLCDFDLNMEKAAKNAGYNIKYFSHVFKAKMGMGFAEYVTNLRLKRAIFLMEQKMTSVKNISLLSGYSDPLYFSKVFKKETGLTPREYIYRLRDEKR